MSKHEKSVCPLDFVSADMWIKENEGKLLMTVGQKELEK